jgi:hypothetical protein
MGRMNAEIGKSRRLLSFFVLVAFSIGGAMAQSVVVVNVYAWDCPPCIHWHNTYKKAWMNSAEFQKVRYVEIDSPTIRQAYNAKYWPDDLNPILKQTEGRGVPRYLIIKDGKIVSDQYGVERWSYMLADLGKFLLGWYLECASVEHERGDGTDRRLRWNLERDPSLSGPTGAKGYSIHMTVTNGAAHAQRNVIGQADSLTITGQIGRNGVATLTAKGLAGFVGTQRRGRHPPCRLAPSRAGIGSELRIPPAGEHRRGISGYAFDKDYSGAPAVVTFRGLTSGKRQTLDLHMAVQTRNHPVVRYETREPVAITDLWGVENKIDTTFENGEIVEVSFGAARQQIGFFTSVTKLKLASRDEAFQKLTAVLSAMLAAPGGVGKAPPPGPASGRNPAAWRVCWRPRPLSRRPDIWTPCCNCQCGFTWW